MRLFDGHDGTPGTREFVCEVEGAGSGWSDPFWIMEYEGLKTEVREKTQNRLNKDGTFLRWTSISLPLLENSTRKVQCTCHHDMEGSIQISAMDGGRLLIIFFNSMIIFEFDGDDGDIMYSLHFKSNMQCCKLYGWLM